MALRPITTSMTDARFAVDSFDAFTPAGQARRPERYRCPVELDVATVFPCRVDQILDHHVHAPGGAGDGLDAPPLRLDRGRWLQLQQQLGIAVDDREGVRRSCEMV
jgi:hypothetical protein